MRFPRAIEGLIISEHEKRGARLFAVLHPITLQVSILDAFEHTVLSWCDGTWMVDEIAASIVGDESAVERCLRFFDAQALLTPQHEAERATPVQTIYDVDTIVPGPPRPRGEDPTDPRSHENVAQEARRIFERLRRSAFKVRGYRENDLRRDPTGSSPKRRHDVATSASFDQAFAHLSAGDVARARAGFAAIVDRLPHSRRLCGILETIDACTDAWDRGSRSVTRAASFE